MNESTDLQLERLCTVNRKAAPSWEYSAVAQRNFSQVSPETSAHQLGAALLVQHPGGHCGFDQIDVLLVLANFLEKIHCQTSMNLFLVSLIVRAWPDCFVNPALHCLAVLVICSHAFIKVKTQ